MRISEIYNPIQCCILATQPNLWCCRSDTLVSHCQEKKSEWCFLHGSSLPQLPLGPSGQQQGWGGTGLYQGEWRWMSRDIHACKILSPLMKTYQFYLPPWTYITKMDGLYSRRPILAWRLMVSESKEILYVDNLDYPPICLQYVPTTAYRATPFWCGCIL